MLEKIEGLPPEIDGLEAKGKISRDDYEKMLKPLLEDAHQTGRKIRFIYHFGPQFENFTVGAVWDDFRLGLKYLRLFERCAVVTNLEWIKTACRIVGPMMPCPVKVFPNEAFQNALQWLQSGARRENLSPLLIAAKEVLVIEPKGALNSEDFDYLSSVVDPWIESHKTLRGLVIHAEKFPGWENLGSLIRHMRFVRDHHRQIERVAVAADGAVSEIMPALAAHFVKAEIKHFAYRDLEIAIQWAGGQHH